MYDPDSVLEGYEKPNVMRQVVSFDQPRIIKHGNVRIELEDGLFFNEQDQFFYYLTHAGEQQHYTRFGKQSSVPNGMDIAQMLAQHLEVKELSHKGENASLDRVIQENSDLIRDIQEELHPTY